MRVLKSASYHLFTPLTPALGFGILHRPASPIPGVVFLRERAFLDGHQVIVNQNKLDPGSGFDVGAAR